MIIFIFVLLIIFILCICYNIYYNRYNNNQIISYFILKYPKMASFINKIKFNKINQKEYLYT